MNLTAWLLAMVQPLVGRILLALGMSVVSVTGFTVALNQMIDYFQASVNALPADILNLFLLAGGGTGAGIMLGALTTRVLYLQLTQASKVFAASQA